MSIVLTPPPRRILVRGVNWLGDAVMTTPALLRLREKFPAAHITLLGPEKLRDLWLHHPAVDATISFTAGEGIFSVAKKLRAEKFDLALVLPNSPRSAMEIFFAGIPQRLGGARPLRNWALTQAVPPRADAVKMSKLTDAQIKNLIHNDLPPSLRPPPKSPPVTAHHIFQYLQLAAAVGANPEPLPPQLTVTPEETEAVRKKFGLEQISSPVFGLNPGAEYGPAKRWPAEKFIPAAHEIQRRTGCVWLLLGGKNDVVITNQIESAIGNRPSAIFNLAGKTNLRELMALLKVCRVLLTNDTGPMHVAAALSTPVVAPFGSTSPELTGPGLPGDTRHQLIKADAPCSPCFLRECPIDFRCMNGISSDRVVEAVLQAAR